MHIYEEFGVRRIINARSFSTKAGGAPLPPEVIEAMRQAADCCIRMDELQNAASRVIAEVTGAEAGIVTSGASAALTLASAACIAGLDVTRMNRLPETAGMPCEIVIHRSHRNDYDHALRAAGARLVEVGFSYFTFPYEVRQAITSNTVALFYQAGGDGTVMPLCEFAQIGREYGKPTIVDAAAELPPHTNLRDYVAAGADLIAISGGKHIRGPQCTGILCGRADLVFSAALQHQDMDVFPNSWPLRELIAKGNLAGPPHHGIGRGFKVGKEEIIGLLTALRSYTKRDFDAELRVWMSDIESIVASLEGIPGVQSYVRFPQPGGRAIPHAVLSIDAAVAGLSANQAITALQEGEPSIFVFERFADAGTIVLMPEALLPGDAEIIAGHLREIFAHLAG
jgi:D-glucosaminate-6-phosphate ammonia-lyase